MRFVTIACDRCDRTIDGVIDGTGFTAGFYDVRDPFWAQFAEPWETKICDPCMFEDERYIAVYGRHSVNN